MSPDFCSRFELGLELDKSAGPQRGGQSCCPEPSGISWLHVRVSETVGFSVKNRGSGMQRKDPVPARVKMRTRRED